MRTYAGHSSAKESNDLFRTNLSRGQTGLSVAFDLPTQCGYDADHPLARGEVGKVGVPISCLDDLERLFQDIPLEEANTSLTINATAPWLMALYLALAERRGVDPSRLRGTVQNDVLKEFLARGTWIVPPEPSLRLSCDLIEYVSKEVPRFNPINLCSYHLREAGASPVQEVAFVLANAVAVLDALTVSDEQRRAIFGRIAFFCNAGIRFVEEVCKMRVFGRLWERIGRERYGVTEAKALRFRCGVQVHSLGLCAEQPENNITRIVLESLGVLLSRDARARALQLPAWNEALGLPRAWDQQWSLRIQQILALETDLLEYPDLFAGSHVIEAKVAEMESEAWTEIERIVADGGAVARVRDGSLQTALLQSAAQRMRAIADGSLPVVGKNCFEEGADSPLLASPGDAVLQPDPLAGEQQIGALERHRESRDAQAASEALNALKAALETGENVLPPSIRCAHAGVTTGEWGQVLREVFGVWNAGGASASSAGRGGAVLSSETIQRVKHLSQALGRPLRLLLGKPGLDGHSGGAEQIALAARDAGWEVVYGGIRCSVDQIAKAAEQEDVHLVGLSILSGAHMQWVPEILEQVDVPVVVGGIIPLDDAKTLRAGGVAAVYTPRDHDIGRIVHEMTEIVAQHHGVA